MGYVGGCVKDSKAPKLKDFLFTMPFGMWIGMYQIAKDTLSIGWV